MIIIPVLINIVLLYVIFWQASLIWAMVIGAPTVYAKTSAMVDALKLADLKKDELIVDLGCGNARSLVVAAKEFGARGVGVERSPYAYLQSKFMVWRTGEQKRVKIVFGDFKAVEKELGKADVVYLYLLHSVLERIEPWFFSKIEPSARVVSLAFKFKDHKPIKQIKTWNLGKETDVRLYQK